MPFHETVTHVAGPVVIFPDGRSIQRCACCGEKLCDSKGQAGPDEPDGSDPAFYHWTERALVQVEGGNPEHYSVIGDFVECESLPEDFCIALVE